MSMMDPDDPRRRAVWPKCGDRQVNEQDGDGTAYCTVAPKRKRPPMQPIVTDRHGVQRFQENSIVQRLLTISGATLNAIATWEGIPESDREQFHQLIGWTVDGCPLRPKVKERARQRANE